MKFFHPLVFVAALQSAAFAADPGLLSLVMPDAKVVSGIEADLTRNSLFGQFLLSQMHPNDADLNNFIAITGFDPRRDVSEIILASNGTPGTPQHGGLVLAKGTFNVTSMTAAILASGGAVSAFNGVNILTYPAHGTKQAPSGIVFLDASTAIMGDVPSVQAAVQQRQSNTPASPSLLDKVAQVSLNNDFWFVTLAPISQFAAALPPKLGSAINGNLLAGINQLSGSVLLGSTVTVSLEAVNRSNQDAQALADVLKFAASLAQMNSQNNAGAAQIGTLLSSLNTTVAGNNTTISLAVPEEQLEHALASMGPHATPAPRKGKVLRQLN